MEESQVVIVGAGPAGLVLALSLAKHHISSIILEKEEEVGEDPRGVYLAGDAVRILYKNDLGIQMENIGHQVQSVNFHKSSFKNPSFFNLDTSRDWTEQTVPEGILQIQPRLGQCTSSVMCTQLTRLEIALRSEIEASKYCDLRCGSLVIGQEELAEGVIVEYRTSQNMNIRIRSSWLIGADGKKGIVRKQFLEPTTNIRQEVGLYNYSGTWVAANLKINLPSPETHPEFPLWEMGLNSLDVYDLFWPSGWHFCSPPGKPTACGRFGPIDARLWRHEFAEHEWDDSKNAVDLLWENLLPMVTRAEDSLGRRFGCGDVTFPRDCIEIRRCRPFTFCQKVVNQWFHNRTILIGDAAHVFPPFGGQGIACGIRDAEGLAWRIAVLLRLPHVNAKICNEMLSGWAQERRQGVDDSTRLTMLNGQLANEEESVGFFIFRNVASFLSKFSLFPKTPSTVAVEKAGYQPTKSGFFLSQYGGGGKMAQVYLKTGDQRPILSDILLVHGSTAMTLLIIGKSFENEQANISALLLAKAVPPSVLSDQSIVCIASNNADASLEIKIGDTTTTRVYKLCSEDDLLKEKLRQGYNARAYLNRLPKNTRYAIIRPDFIIFSAARSISQLEHCLQMLKERVGQ